MTAASGPRQVTRIINEKAAGMGVEQRSFTDEEILRRLLFASVNEACKILDEGKAYRASDIDVMWLNGFGFPRYRGGLMYWADGIGVAEVYRQIQAWHQQYGAGPRPPCCAASPKPALRWREAKPGRPM
jgi:3-hydroxyacyl-CoA dehydrogenase